MVSNYQEFQDEITAILKMRVKNYMNTDPDMSAIENLVYTDITGSVVLDAEYSDIQLVPGQTSYYADGEEYNANGDIVAYFGDTFDMVDSHGDDVSDYFIETYAGAYDVINNSVFTAVPDGLVIMVRRRTNKITELSPRMYNLILPAMIEGIIFNVQDSIPSQVDAEVGNLSYQRFFSEKKKLREQLPQTIWAGGEQLGSRK